MILKCGWLIFAKPPRLLVAPELTPHHHHHHPPANVLLMLHI